MNQTLSLYRLQQIDSQIDRIQASMESIKKALEDDSELARLKELANTAEKRYQSAQTTLKQSELVVNNQHIKIEQMQSSLYGKKAHSPKELQDLQNDVIALKRHLVILEDTQIEAMIECEEAEAEMSHLQAILTDAQNQRSKDNSNLLHEQAAFNTDRERFLVERKAAATAIPPAELDLYDHLRKQHRGLAVASISENSCGACGATLNRAFIQSVHSANQMALCPSCGRILYGS